MRRLLFVMLLALLTSGGWCSCSWLGMGCGGGGSSGGGSPGPTPTPDPTGWIRALDHEGVAPSNLATYVACGDTVCQTYVFNYKGYVTYSGQVVNYYEERLTKVYQYVIVSHGEMAPWEWLLASEDDLHSFYAHTGPDLVSAGCQTGYGCLWGSGQMPLWPPDNGDDVWLTGEKTFGPTQLTGINAVFQLSAGTWGDVTPVVGWQSSWNHRILE